MKNAELELVSKLSNTPKDKIKFVDSGFLSRAYIIENGQIVFKFKKDPNVTYKNEIKTLNYINSLGLKISTQKIGWTSDDDTFLGLYGIQGKSLEYQDLSKKQCRNYGKQISEFLKVLHKSENINADLSKVDEEIKAWQERFETSKYILEKYFKKSDLKKMEFFVRNTVPKKLSQLENKYVFSHGDLGMGNILVDENNKIGIIDFSESIYLDEAADFMDIENDALIAEILNCYQADENLREKVRIRREIRPMFVVGTYKDRPKTEIENFVIKIKSWLNKN